MKIEWRLVACATSNMAAWLFVIGIGFDPRPLVALFGSFGTTLATIVLTTPRAAE